MAVASLIVSVNAILTDRCHYGVVLAMLLLVGLSYGVFASSIGWLSDDYSNVSFYTLSGKTPDMAGLARVENQGHWTPVRPLTRPFLTGLGLGLGSGGAHVLSVGLHFGVGLLLFTLLRQLEWPIRMAGLAALLFLIAPWHLQAVYWWSASVYILSTLLFLAGLMFYLKAVSARISLVRVSFFVLAMGFILLSMLFTELWLLGGLTLFVVTLYQMLRTSGTIAGLSGWIKVVKRAMLWTLPLTLPYVMWAMLYMATNVGGDRYNPETSLIRYPIVLLSTHLRAIQWFTEIPWQFNFVYSGVFSIVAAIGMAALLYAYLRPPGKKQEAEIRQSVTQAPFALSMSSVVLLFVAFFSAPRMVYILQGGVSLHSRHAYAGSLGLCILLAWIIGHLLQTRYARGVRVLVCVFFAFCLLTSLSLFQHISRVTASERIAVDAFVEETGNRQKPFDLYLLGQPESVAQGGEMNIFHEGEGMWLHFHLDTRGIPVRRVQVLGEVPQAMSQYAVVMEWQGDKLEPFNADNR